MSGPNLPDYDSCVETTSAPETTTAAETTIGTETSPETAGTTTMEMTTGGADCSGFYPGFVCTPEVSAIDTITHIMTPKECQVILMSTFSAIITNKNMFHLNLLKETSSVLFI